ncbi:MAG: hypothetical protein ACFB10_14585 [Salibacteraceae bacterium]
MAPTNSSSHESPTVVAGPASSGEFDPSVSFINEQVLQASAAPFTGSAKLIADQAAAMMVQDVRGFMQGSQQVIMLATARAISQTLSQDEAAQKAGAKTLKLIAKIQTNLTVFTGEVGTIASKIANDFNAPNATFETSEDTFDPVTVVDEANEAPPTSDDEPTP